MSNNQKMEKNCFKAENYFTDKPRDVYSKKKIKEEKDTGAETCMIDR